MAPAAESGLADVVVVLADAGCGETDCGDGAYGEVVWAPAGDAPQPAGSATGDGPEVVATARGSDDPVAAAPADPPRVRYATISPPEEIIDTTDQPSADFSVSLAARAAGSYDDVVTLMNSAMPRTLPGKTCPLTVGNGANVPVGRPARS